VIFCENVMYFASQILHRHILMQSVTFLHRHRLGLSSPNPGSVSVMKINVTNIHRDHDMVADVDVDVAADIDVDMAIDKDVDVAADMDDDDPCIFWPISNVAQIF
jgi:hypothetical protein